MANDPEYSQNWFDTLRRALMEVFDGRYTQKDGVQRLINKIVLGTCGFILITVLGTIISIATGIIKP